MKKNKISHVNTTILLLSAILKSAPERYNYNIDLVTGLPVAYLSQKKQFIDSLSSKSFEVEYKGVKRTIHINRVLVFPQAAGALFNEILDDSGNIRRPILATKKICIIDVGFRTSDYVTLEYLQYVDKESGTFDMGISTALRMVYTDVNLYELEFDENYKNIIEERKSIVGDSIIDNLYMRLPRLEDYFAIYVAGGGGKYLLKRLSRAILVENPQRANALGFLKTGRIRLNENNITTSNR